MAPTTARRSLALATVVAAVMAPPLWGQEKLARFCLRSTEDPAKQVCVVGYAAASSLEQQAELRTELERRASEARARQSR
jgi:hypothetical protein